MNILHPMHRICTSLLVVLVMLIGVVPVAAAPVSVDLTQDDKALGYPDSRKVVRDSKGHLYLAYRKHYTMVSTSYYHIFVAKSLDNGRSWTVLNNQRPVETVGDYQQRVPSITVTSDDVIHVVWYGNDAEHTGTNERQIKHVRSVDGGTTWSQWKNIAVVMGYQGEDLWQEHPTIAVDGTNTLYVVWQGKDPAHDASQCKWTTSTDGGITWTPWNNINPSRTNCSRPTLIPSSDNRQLYVLAYGSVGGTQQIIFTWSLDHGSTWSPWTAIAPSSKEQRHVSVVIDTKNHLHAVWRQEPTTGGKSVKPQIHYATYADGTWSAATAIAAQPRRYQFFPSIAVTSTNTIWVVWTESTKASNYPSENPTTGQIVFVSKPVDGAWSDRTALTDDTTHIYASLRWGRYANGGNVDVVWLNNTNGPTKTIMHDTVGTW